MASKLQISEPTWH